MFPNLAGQQSAYIILQLDAFRGHARGDPNAQAYMWGMASQLSDDTIKALADYYAAQKAPPGEAGDPALLAEGQKHLHAGDFDAGRAGLRGVPRAECRRRGCVPALAGQHADYLVAQLVGFQSGIRANAPIMANVVRTHERPSR